MANGALSLCVAATVGGTKSMPEMTQTRKRDTHREESLAFLLV